MTTKLDKPLRREVMISREPWVVTITPTGLKLTRKGRRKGLELEWGGLVSGDAALAAALNASVRQPQGRKLPRPKGSSTDKPAARARRASRRRA